MSLGKQLKYRLNSCIKIQNNHENKDKIKN